MPALSTDQEIRVHCLQICGGSVAEAKNAYFWVMGDQNANKTPPSDRSVSQMLRERQEQMEAAQRQLGRQVQNDGFPLGGLRPLVSGDPSN